MAAAAAVAVFRRAPVVVLAPTGDPTAIGVAARQAATLRAPLLLAPGNGKAAGPDARALATAVADLGARWVLAAAGSAGAAHRIHGVTTVTDPAALPTVEPPAPPADLTMLVPANPPPGMVTGVSAARATATAAGARVVPVRGSDPRTDPKAIAALAKHPPTHVIAVGPDFGPAGTLAARVATAATGRQLPGGGQVMFPGRTLVALYGHPHDKNLGALGQQDLPAAITRAKKAAAPYDDLSKYPVVPTFEIIATVADALPGPDGDYSVESTVAALRPWVDAATTAGMYVILDLQPGRADLLEQAKRYADLLTNPAVGLALDPEWKLGPNQLPLHQIGHVDPAEINRVIDWLAQLTARHHLPQKVLVLHQFRTSMLPDVDDIDTHNDNVAVLIHMDGQGTPADKEQTWRAIVHAAPEHVWFGWKNFYAKDTPMITPAKTMARTPVPVMISYQ